MTRTGKIARLPRNIRDQLNRRLEDGEDGCSLVAWLNSLPEVKRVLDAKFGGRPVSEQNLSEWKQGGYQDWLAHTEIVAKVDELAADACDLEGIMDGPLTDHLAMLVAVRYASVLTNKNGEPDEAGQQKIRALRALCRDIIELRRSDHNAQCLAMERERWGIERNQLNEEQREKELLKAKQNATAPLWAAMKHGVLAEAFGGGETGEKMAAIILEIDNDLPPGTLSKLARASGTHSGGANPAPTGSK